MKNKGLTLIELILTIVVAGIVLMPTSFVVIESVRNTYVPEKYTIASSLLEREVERVSNLRFSAVVNEGPTSYTGSFSTCSYQVAWAYVNSGALNTTVISPTDYKRAVITVICSGFPGVSAVTLVTNN